MMIKGLGEDHAVQSKDLSPWLLGFQRLGNEIH